MLLIPRPPAFALHDETSAKQDDFEPEMNILDPGVDAVPAPALTNTTKKHYRYIVIGKKKLPQPGESGKRKETFWATVSAVGDDLESLKRRLGEKEYETKTRGTRHEEAARLVARGAYAIVNTSPKVPSQRTTHLGYTLSHPSPENTADVQTSLGVYPASSFVVQVKNPLAPATGPQGQQIQHAKSAEYPEWIMQGVFGKDGTKGRESYGLRFSPCETPELLDYEGAQLLLIAAREGEEGLETSLGEGRGEALVDAENKETEESVQNVFKELGMDAKSVPMEPLEGKWI